VSGRSARWLFTCEHASRDVPARYAAAFARAGPVMDSHRAWDPGALEVFSELAGEHADHAMRGNATRLLVDLNRSLHHPRLFSEFTRGLPEEERRRIIDEWWRPFREEAEATVAGWIAEGTPVIHISVHSFTPVLDGRTRAAELGILYDPARSVEAGMARRLREKLASAGWRVRLNYPYRGVSDGHTTALRRHHADGYSGVELELNQGLFFAGSAKTGRLLEDLDGVMAELRG
jgi:predicted N-formylglutamate amidohydrolase